MKKTIQLLSICATLAVFALPAFANGTALQPAGSQDQCTDENKSAWYTEFRALIRTDQAKANELARKYLACPPKEGDTPEAKEAEAKITDYLKKFVAAYEKAVGATEKAKRKVQFNELITKKDYVKAFELGRQVVAEDPDYLDGYINLSFVGYAAASLSGNKAFVSDGANYGKKAIETIESGKAPADWKPPSKDEVLAKLNFWVGFQRLESAPEETIPLWIKAASTETFKKDAQAYYNLGIAYETPAQKQITDYNKFNGQQESNESKLALENVHQIVDRTIDAFARAVALAGTDPKNSVLKTDALERLTGWYKLRHDKSDAGLNEFIAGVLSKPLPPEPQPITTLPTPAATTPTSAIGTSTSASSAASAPANGGAVQAPAKTTTSTTIKTGGPGKPKTRRAHAGR